jgi:glycosyltransferase involved in cell wall biosynthesis
MAVSEFQRRLFVKAGFDPRQVVVKPNFVFDDGWIGKGDGGFLFYAGRLAEEKGVRTLLNAARILGPGVGIKIAGEGPLEHEVRRCCRDCSHVQYLGALPETEIRKRMGEAAIVVVPSVWYETFGRVVIEAYSSGTPVIASRIGALEELIVDGKTGLLFAPGDASALAGAVRSLLADVPVARRMRARARELFEQKYGPEENYRLLSAILSRATASAGRPSAGRSVS